MVLKVLEDNLLHVKLSKCVFWKAEVKYLNRVVNIDGIRMATKIDVIRNWPRTKDIPELRFFVGLANYFGDLFQGLGPDGIVDGLFRSLRLPLEWRSQAIKAFEVL